MRFPFDKIDWKLLAENKRLKINIGLAIILIIVFLFLIDIVSSIHWFRNSSIQEEGPTVTVIVKAPVPAEPRPVSKPAPKPISKPVPTQRSFNFKGARVAIILDDAGGNSIDYKSIFSIKQPLTLAILPNLGTSQKIAREAHEAGMEVILHVPMEPVNGNFIRHDGGMVLCSQSDDEIKKTVEDDLNSFAYADGINNHEGSKATADERVMRAVLGTINSRHMFFIDSRTSASSLARALAVKLNVPSAENNIFLDSTTDPKEIAARLNRLVSMAKARGYAVGIGHATRRSTIDLLKKLMPEYAKEGVRFVFASEIVK